jgi:release factor glutamine methyltransferase
VQVAVRAATETLRAAGIASPEHDARSLAMHVLGLSKPSELVLADEIDAAQYDALVARRARREPLQHLTGSVGFRWIELEVGPGVFVPRPETESVVQWAVDHAQPGALMVDLCTGSGTIAFSLANEVPGAIVHGVERDPAALEWARRNAANRVRAGDPLVTLHLGSVDGALPELDGLVDLVASNPPYVALHERGQMDVEVVDHDPEIALFAGDDGLDVIRLVEQAAWRLLKPGGLVVVEHSDRQGTSAPAVFGEGWTEVQDHQDLTGRDRYVTARKDLT